jgi:hypothetical protein
MHYGTRDRELLIFRLRMMIETVDVRSRMGSRFENRGRHASIAKGVPFATIETAQTYAFGERPRGWRRWCYEPRSLVSSMMYRVLETFISEGGRQGPILVAEIIVNDLDGAILGKHADSRVGDGVLGLA